MRNQTINLDLIPGMVMPVVHLSQYDQDVDGALIINVFENGVPYDLTDCTVYIEGRKPDGTVWDYECTVYNTYVTSAVQYQMTVMAAKYLAELQIYKNNASIGSLNFIFDIEPVAAGQADLSQTDIPALITQITAARDVTIDAMNHVVFSNYLYGLQDVKIRDVANEDILQYDAVQEKWVNVRGDDVGGASDIIAPKETSPSLHDYAIGDQFIFQKKLYTATSAIAIGDGIVPGTNCELSDSITEQIGDLDDEINTVSSTLSAQLSAKLNEEVVTTVEATTTASKNYNAGEWFINDGDLYKVLEPISQDSPLITEPNLQDAIKSLTIYSDTDHNYHYYAPTDIQIGEYIDICSEQFYSLLYDQIGEATTLIHEGEEITSQKYTELVKRRDADCYEGAASPQAFNAGDYAVWLLTPGGSTYEYSTCKFTANISQGETLEEGVNLIVMPDETLNSTATIDYEVGDIVREKKTILGYYEVYNFYKVIKAISAGDMLSDKQVSQKYTLEDLVNEIFAKIYREKLAASNIATVEPTTTASKNYDAGDWFIYDGELYKTLVAVTAGSSLFGNNSGNLEKPKVAYIGNATLKSDEAEPGQYIYATDNEYQKRDPYIWEAITHLNKGDELTDVNTENLIYDKHPDYPVTELDFCCEGGTAPKAFTAGEYARWYVQDNPNYYRRADVCQFTIDVSQGDTLEEGVNLKMMPDESMSAVDGQVTGTAANDYAVGEILRGSFPVEGKSYPIYKYYKVISTITTGDTLTMASDKSVPVTVEELVMALDGKKLDSTNVTTVQVTLTADKAYAVNDAFIYQGQLYKVTSAITQGGTIVLSGTGQNASTTTIEELISINGGGGVTSFKGRTGAVTPQSGDYTAAQVGALNDDDVATVESTLTASKAYAVNDPFIYAGQLYKATSAILSGGTITIGTNASTTTIEELLALKVIANGGEAGDTVVTFTDPSADAAITSGSPLKTIIGLIKYKFAHLISGHTIVNSSGTSQTARAKLKFTGNVTVTDDSSNDQTVINMTGGGSGGHTILNSSGTAMAARGKLQFNGATVTDDSTNNKTVVTAPTPDYVDEQYSSSKTYSKGMTCISGNIRYKYINSTASSGHQPPNTTYWEVCSVADELLNDWVLIDTLQFTTSADHDKTETVNVNTDLSQYSQVRTEIYMPIINMQIAESEMILEHNPTFSNDAACLMTSYYYGNSYARAQLRVNKNKVLLYKSMSAYWGGDALSLTMKIYAKK